jgi:hypothetical protein
MSRSRAKGTRFESATVAVFAERFPYAERRAMRGAQDGGDICGLPIVAECKNTKTIDLAGGCTEAAKAAVRTGARGWVAVFKRPRHSDRAAYAVTSLEFFAELLAAWDQTQPEQRTA